MHNYQNEFITKSLEDAYGCIADIVLGVKSHPLVPYYENWMANCPHGADRTHHGFQLIQRLQCQVIPGDRSLLESFLINLKPDIAQRLKVKFSQVSSDINERVEILATMLFTLVIFRCYLGVKPQNDEQIFHLAFSLTEEELEGIPGDDPFFCAKQGRLERILTLPEKAKEADHTSLIHKLVLKPDTEMIIPNDPPLAKVLTSMGQPYTFINSFGKGLSGGPPFIPYYKKQPPTSTTKWSIPRPRPLKRKPEKETYVEVSKNNGTEDIEHRSKRRKQ